ncbi:MAG: ferredoxin family protein [Thermodesulfobacteriota bacterium]
MAQRKKHSSPVPKPAEAAPEQTKVTFYPAWCKRCGNCEAFCPRQAIGRDEWGYPFLAQPERCTLCGLCEMLCPDFALSVGEPVPLASLRPSVPADASGAEDSAGSSPERLAPTPRRGD